MINILPRITAFLLLFCCFSCLTPPAARATDAESAPGKAVFLPYHVPDGQEYDYLRDGLLSVLATRVAARTGLQTVYNTPNGDRITGFLQKGNFAKAFALLGKSGADYLLMGSMEKKGSGYLFTVEVADRQSGLHQFSRTADSLDEALKVMDQLSWDIAVKMFGKTRPSVSGIRGEKKEPVEKGMSGFQTAHPDRAYKQGLYSGLVAGFDNDRLKILSTHHSPKLPYGINDMDVGDLDGDSFEEIVLAATARLYVYRYDEGAFRQAAVIDIPSHLRIHAVSLADLNGNGRAEIYVSANNRKNPESVVVEWDGTRAAILAERVPWYLRVIRPEGRPILLGQSPGPRGSGAVIGRDIFQLELESGELKKVEKVTLPTGLNIFDIAWADLDGSGERKMVAIDRSNALLVYDRSGELLWSDAGMYGCSSNYLGTMETAASGSGRVYIPPGIVVHDFNEDGREDVLVGRNRMKVIKYFNRYRYFEGSTMKALSWQDGELTALWESGTRPEYLVASQVVGIGNGKKNRFRLYAAEGQNNFSFGFWQTKTTRVLVQEIELNNQQDGH